MEDKIQILTVAIGILTFLLIFITSRLAATRREVELIEQQAYLEGQLKTIERLVSTQEEMLEMRRNSNNYLLDILLLAIEGENIKHYLHLVNDTDNPDNDDED